MKLHPAPLQDYCKRCEKLFCYFQITRRRVFCSSCIEIRRAADLVESNDFYKGQRLIARLLREVAA